VGGGGGGGGGGSARCAQDLILQKIYGQRPPMHVGMDGF